ncbi:VWA domain-containing protein [Actinoplanes awajinensis]|uniref:CoxE n=1 Tax=Actinoplanes awajinensis subsp. mycoplanecinus TaxID=135947 RepID=A0A101JR36_9ACTN|nr:vWA domain-containing protein [Actinoplanes awajinensis]KUL31429.1 CoxE [Actinoplanes awajinensis subsp. mycoplanecinus]
MSHPNTHRPPTPAVPAAADPDWKPWSTAWTKHVPVLTGRTDLHVHVAPGAGGGAPECFYPDLRRIEVDARYIADTPDITDPRKAGHKKIVPTGYGLLVHGAAHAAHSLWTTPPGTPPVLAEVAELLEESRAEGRQRGRRRADRRWLRHIINIVVHPGTAPVDDPWHAGVLAALLLARVDARILTSKDVRAIRAAVTTVIGKPRLHRLREIWKQAHTVDDHDAITMIRLARRWCEVLGIDPWRQRQVPVADAGMFPGRLDQALTDLLASLTGITPADYRAQILARRNNPPTDWPRTDPTPEQQAAARRLADRIQQARVHHPETVRRGTVLPPGRLRTRQAIAADAQAAAGQTPTAQPWQHRTQQPPPKPTLHLAVLVDLSGSMSSYAAELSSAAWIFAHAARRGEVVTTTIGFGDSTTLLVPPHGRPKQVLQMQIGGGTYTFCDAVKLADQLLGLRHARTLRLVAVVSDGDLDDKPAAQKIITTLHKAGCAVLWLHPDGYSQHTFADTTTITVADPVDAVSRIADAAVAALENS